MVSEVFLVVIRDIRHFIVSDSLRCGETSRLKRINLKCPSTSGGGVGECNYKILPFNSKICQVWI